jgi:hypothetical protein
MKKVLLNIFSIMTAMMFFVACSDENIAPSDSADAAARKGSGKPAAGNYVVSSSVDGYTLSITVDQSATQAASHILLQVTDCDGNFVDANHVVGSSIPVDYTTGNGTGCAFDGGAFIKFDNLDMYEKNGTFTISITFNTQIEAGNILIKSATNCFPFALNFTSNCGEVVEGQTETAFAFGGDDASCFLNMGFNRWGWSNGPVGEGDYAWAIYAAAGQCDLDKGTHVGTLNVSYHNGSMTVTYNIFSGYSLEDTHLYVGAAALPSRNGKSTVAPGAFPYNGTATTTINGLSGNVYVVAHAVVGGL